MNLTKAAGLLLGLASCVPVWQGLAAIDRGDHLGALIALFLAWVLARAAVEVTAAARGGALVRSEGSHDS